MLKSPALRAMYMPPANKAENDAEQRIGNDTIEMPGVSEWADPESEIYKLAVAAEMKQKHSGAKILFEAWQKEQVACA